jgi:hypothetical protein
VSVDAQIWRLKLKRRPISVRYRAGLLAAVTALVAAPYGEELVHCVRADGFDNG